MDLVRMVFAQKLANGIQAHRQGDHGRCCDRALNEEKRGTLLLKAAEEQCAKNYRSHRGARENEGTCYRPILGD